MKMASFKSLKLSSCFDDCIELALNRPEKRNAFDDAMIREIMDCFETLREQPHRVLMIRGEGPVFCAGGDIQWMHQVCLQSEAARLFEATRIRNLFHTIHSHPRPTIAIVHGGAFGGGVGLAAACDYIVATDDSIFSTSESKLGIVPACLAPYLVRRIGFVRARRMFLSAEKITSREGFELGLVDRVTQDASSSLEIVADLVKSLKVPSPQAQRDAKSLLLELERLEADNCSIKYLAASWGSHDGVEGTGAFIENRTPVWQA